MQRRFGLTFVWVLGILLFGCSSYGFGSREPVDPPLRGADAPAYESPQALLADLEAGLPCDNASDFDPTENIAPDGFNYEKPAGVICQAAAQELYVVVYETTADRHEALAHGEINASLCAIRTGAATEPDDGGWFSVVGANWRVAIPDRGSAVGQITDVVPGSAAEPFSCSFSE